MTIDLLCNLLALLCLVVLSCLWIWGVHGAYVILGRNKYLDELPDNMKKPLFDCPVCMPTIHVPLVFLISGTTGAHLPFHYVALAWIMTAGLNFVIKEYLYPEQE
jgi:hypothetical protein